MINSKVKIEIGKLGMSNLKIYNGISDQRMILEGGLEELYLIDYSRYPQTISEELECYDAFGRHLICANVDSDNRKDML